MINIDQINNYYKTNIKYYNNIKTDIINKISGRICHHRVVVLRILIELSKNIKTYVEIGTHNGTSMSYVVKGKEKMDCYGIDLFSKELYKRDSLDIGRTRMNILNNNISGSTTHLMVGNSKDSDTLKRLTAELNAKGIDLLFIDGDHSLSGVKNDFEKYSELVNDGGYIVFDDYNKIWKDIVEFCDSIKDERYTKIGVFDDNEYILYKNKT